MPLPSCCLRFSSSKTCLRDPYLKRAKLRPPIFSSSSHCSDMKLAWLRSDFALHLQSNLMWLFTLYVIEVQSDQGSAGTFSKVGATCVGSVETDLIGKHLIWRVMQLVLSQGRSYIAPVWIGPYPGNINFDILFLLVKLH